MPAEDASPAFAEAAAADGIELGFQSFDWLSEKGHIGLLNVAVDRRDPALREPVTEAVEVLKAIYESLKGDSSVLPNLRSNLLLPVDLVHEPTGTLIELDESRHFTSYRRATFDLYPPNQPLGFDLEEYRELCQEWASESDNIAHNLPAKGFGFGGVQRERAYRDALRDLATPAMGHPPLVRIVALDGDGAAAYQRHREALVKQLKR